MSLIPRRSSRRAAAAVALAVAPMLAAGIHLGAQAPPPSPRSFTYLAPGFTQELVGAADIGVFAEDPNVAKVLGGVAFAPDGDVWVADCVFEHTKLRRIDMGTPLTPVRNSTPSVKVTSAPVQTEGGCGLTNHPDGSLYSNSTQGIYKLNADTGAYVAGPLGQPGNALGIAVDPVTSRLIYAGEDCHDRLVTSPTTCTLWDLNPATGVTTPFGMFPHADMPFVDGIYFSPTGDHLFVTNRIAEEIETTLGAVEINQLTVVTRPTGAVTAPGTAQIAQHLPMIVEPDGVAFHSVEHFVVTNDEASGTMSRFDFPGGDYALPPTTYSEIQPVDGGGDPIGSPIRIYGTTFASGGHRGDLTQVGADGCIYATQGRNFSPLEYGTRYDDGIETSEDSVVRICATNGGGFEPPPGVRSNGQRGSIDGSVYLDTNGNHVIDATDAFLPGVTVTLVGSSVAPMASSAGPAPAYAFTNLNAGAYTVNVPATVSGYALSSSTPSGTSATITAAGEHVADINFLYEAGQLTGSVYLDSNDSGTIDGGDTFLSGVPVQLTGPAGASTQSSGGPVPTYSFPGLPGGSYQVSVPATFGGYKLESASPAPRTLVAGGLVSNVDFLYVRATLSGFAYVDVNNSGARDAGDLPLSGVTITGPGGATRTTQGDGSYSYAGLSAATYSVGASTPASGYALSTASPLSVNVPEGGNVENVNFGYRPGELSGFAYIDANLNGVKDPSESGLGNVGIVLSSGASASTGGNGAYAFSDLVGQSYTVGAPSNAFGYVLVTAPTLSAVLPAGQTIANLNFGYAMPPPPPGSISGVAYVDANSNGSFDSGETVLTGVAITLSGAASAAATTTGSGYTFGALTAATYSVSAPSTVPGYTRSTASPLSVVLAAGENRTHVDFGYQAPTPPPAAFVTYTQGGWGAPPNGNNPGMLLQLNFNTVYNTCPSKTVAPTTTANTCVTIGSTAPGRFFLRFTSSAAVMNFLPAGGAPKALKASANNPTSSAAGVFAGQVLAVQLAVNFSNAGVITPGLASLKVASGQPLAGQTVSQVLAIANRVLGGDLTALPSGMSISALNDVMTRINENFDNGTTNNGFLVP